jgi:hypothetical protein
MRSLFAIIIGLVVMTGSAARADNRVFIIANPPAANGIDRCLASGGKCGADAAKSYCLSRDFVAAKEFRRVDPDEVTGSVPKTAAGRCPNGGCDEYVAITCQR